MMRSISTLHGTSVDVKGSGILICGKPGTGKSSLALQLIDRGAVLIADDQTVLSHEEEGLILRSPASLKGIMEVRGIGLCSFPSQDQSSLRLAIELCEKEELERLPAPLFIEYHNLKIPLLKLKKHDPLGAIKVELKLFHKDELYVR
jgi:serine kinase of HPr protein (carbohydrate metabolism regulator)